MTQQFKNIQIIFFTLLASFFTVQSQANIAFQNPVGLPSAGSQADVGPLNLGLEFTVNSPVVVTQLGAYDITIGGSGTGFGSLVQVGIFSATSGTFVSPIVDFIGNAGTVVDSSRFQDITALTLAPGTYMVVGSGYGVSTAPDWNAQIAGLSTSPLSFDGGDDALTMGISYYDLNSTIDEPTNPDSGPYPQYAAGTFAYSPVVPEPSTTALAVAGLVLLGALQFKHPRLA